MAHIPRGAASSAAAPLLDIWLADAGVISDPDAGSLTWTIVDVSTDAKELVPVTVTGPVTVNLTTHRIKNQTGHFAAVASPLVPADAEVGAYEIRWSWTVDGAAQSYAQRFDVLEGVPRGLGGGYALVSDFRRDEVCEDGASTIKLLRLIASESAFIEQVTRRFFEPRLLSFKADGQGGDTLLLGQPIIALSSVKVRDEPIAIDFDADELRVYNRHLGGMLDPDDRAAPRVTIPNLRLPVEFGGTWSGIHVFPSSFRASFPSSALNVSVEGLFGYTDPDGTHLGKTPDKIREVTRLLVRRQLPSLADTEGQFEAQEGHRVKRIKTRDQEIEYNTEATAGVLTITGDASIDRILSLYVRTLRVGST